MIMSAEDQDHSLEPLEGQSCDRDSMKVGIARLALLHVRPTGCEDCMGSKIAAKDLAGSVIKNGAAIRQGVGEYKEVFNEERCKGMQPNEKKQFCHEPDYICTHDLGAEAVRIVFAEEN